MVLHDGIILAGRSLQIVYTDRYCQEILSTAEDLLDTNLCRSDAGNDLVDLCKHVFRAH